MPLARMALNSGRGQMQQFVMTPTCQHESGTVCGAHTIAWYRSLSKGYAPTILMLYATIDQSNVFPNFSFYTFAYVRHIHTTIEPDAKIDTGDRRSNRQQEREQRGQRRRWSWWCLAATGGVIVSETEQGFPVPGRRPGGTAAVFAGGGGACTEAHGRHILPTRFVFSP